MPFFRSVDDAISAAIVIGALILISFPVHEYAHARMAHRLGDGTAKLFGRLTLDPRAHFDPMGGILLILSVVASGGTFGFGWAKPTPVNTGNLRGRFGDAFVSLAGPVSNLALATVGALLIHLFAALNVALPAIVDLALFKFLVINIALMVLNLIPIPPLDGSKVLYSLMSPRTAWRVRPLLDQYGPLILLVSVFFPILPGGQTILSAIFEIVAVPVIRLLLGA